MSSDFGTNRPIILYGSAFGSTWNLETDNVNVDSLYNQELAKDFLYAKSGKIWVHNKGTAAGKRRYYHKLTFFDLTDAQANKLISATGYNEVQIRPHANSTSGEYVTCTIKRSIDPARAETNADNNEIYAWILELESTEYITHLTDAP